MMVKGLLIALVVLPVQEPGSREDIERNLGSYLVRWAEEYVPYIMTDEEKTLFGALQKPEEKLAFIDTFWRRRDPTPETPANEFRDAYAERFAYANNQFRTSRPGWKTDRGRIYLLMGPPTTIDRNPMGRNSMERGSEVWTYMNLRHPDLPSSMEIRFVDFFGHGEFEIVSSLDAAHVRPTGFLPSYSDLDYFGQRRAYPFRMTDAGEERVDEGSLVSQRFNFLQDLRSAETPPEAQPQQPLSALVGATVTFASLPFDLGPEFVYDRESAIGRVPVALGLRYDNLSARRGPSGRGSYSIDVFASLQDGEGKTVDELERQLNFELSTEEKLSDGLRYFFSLSAPAGSYTLRFLVRDNVSKSLGTKEEAVEITGDPGRVFTSTLLLADVVERVEAAGASEPFVFGDVRVLPNPTRVFHRGEPMWVYFQAYGLGLRDGKNQARVEYTFLSRDQELWKPSQVNLFPTDRTDRGIHSSFASDRFPPGRYVLRVKLEDLIRGETATREVEFVVQ
jgi:GWxTD domain-containing protein